MWRGVKTAEKNNTATLLLTTAYNKKGPMRRGVKIL